MLEVFILLVNVLDSLVDSVLANILTRENEPVALGDPQRHGVVAVINLVEMMLPEVADESTEEVPLRHCQCGVLIHRYVIKI